MWTKILIGFAVVIVIFLGYVSTRPPMFHYERSGFIKASPEKIYPYISSLKMGAQWSPYEKDDPSLKTEFSGTDGAVDSVETFEGKKAGAGTLTILKLEPNKSAQIQLKMTKPFFAINIIDYTLTPEGEGTRFTWGMTGENGFIGKLIGVIIDCEKMIGSQFEEGIANLKQVVESQK